MVEKFEKDGTLPAGVDSDPEHMELRTILEDPVGQKYIGAFAKKTLTHESFFAWTEIQEYRSIPTADYQRGMAMHIYQKYIKEGAILQLGCVKPADRQCIKAVLDQSKYDASVTNNQLYDKVQQAVFIEMYHNTFQRFKVSDEYSEMRKMLRETYNRVCLSDFDYIAQIGEGGFGRVVHVRKKSTMAHLAMKIQLKTALLETFSDDPNRIDNERRVLAATYHPFIVGMNYAFQTETLAIMVLDLVTCGDLQEAINQAPNKRLNEVRVQFYVAEIILALSHLHELGLMFRDLKPCNVLLGQDGHVKLTDMGGVAEFAKGTCLDPMDSCSGSSPYMMEIGGQRKGNTEARKLSQSHRRRSIMGTHGYMAPEMVILLSQPRAVRKGYTKAVDFWSLGVTMYKLLTGVRPFENKRFLNEILTEVRFPPYMSAEAKDLVIRLLDGNEHRRLGASPELLAELKAHPFFNGIDWVRLSVRHMIPPYVPDAKPLEQTPQYASFDALMEAYRTQDEADRSGGTPMCDWTQKPSPADQRFFQSWDFISMQTLKIEMGIANEMVSHDTNFKVRQLMGDPGDSSKASPRGVFILRHANSMSASRGNKLGKSM
ncbi:kinase-like domain-containing protein [Tribonema minus]|uniref:non-specific serine/threonine protein kinase n=1 Tax=Tribonema minus TaxID=303371 RepID=A0A835ZAC1_9STRA|nr:kinase-like domain-containing protein [Tribonema minus]